MPSKHPVVVAGGGPGGSATALRLRQHGHAVVVYDRAVFPRDKVCGDVVLPEAQRALAQLDLPWQELRAQSYTCTGSRYVAPGGAQVSGAFHTATGQAQTWWIIKRLHLDAWLLNAAASAGAAVMEGHEVCGVLHDETGQACGVRVKEPSGVMRDVPASAVVGADGATSAVARSLGVFHLDPEHLCLAARTYVKSPVKLPQPYLEIFTTKDTLPGCAWILPTSDGEWNVGVGIIKADSTRLGLSPTQMFDHVMQTVPLFSARLHGLTLPRLRGWSLPGSSQGRAIVGHGSLLVGDAGAMVDPFTGHGIHHALMAGIHAGDVLHQALQENDLSTASLMDYDRRCRAQFLNESALGYDLQRLHAHAPLMRAAVQMCNSHQGMRWAFLALLGHAVPRHDVVSWRGLGKALLTTGPAPRRSLNGNTSAPSNPDTQVTA